MRTISDKTIDASTNFPGGTAVAVDERIISYDLIGSNAVLKTYVSYHDASGDHIGEENFDITDVIDPGTVTALVTELEAEVGSCAEAELIIGNTSTSRIEYLTDADAWGILKLTGNNIPELNNVMSLMASEGDYDSPIDKTVQTIADQSRYNAFGGPLRQLGSYILLPYRSGTNHIENGQIRFIFYNALTDTWADRETFQTPAFDVDYRDAKGGVLGGEKIILFTLKYQPSTGQGINCGYFLSHSLGTNDWDDYVVLTPPVDLTGGITHGDIIESDTPGTYYACAYGASPDASVWKIWLWKIVYAAGDVTITIIDVYSGATQYSESVIFGIGGGKYVILARRENINGIYQFNSTDGGETWGSPVATDYGTGSAGDPMIPSRPIMLNGELINLVYDRETEWILISKVDPDVVFASPTSWNPVNYEPCDFLGYQWICEVPGYTDRLLVIWSEEHGGEASTNSAILYGRVDDFSAF